MIWAPSAAALRMRSIVSRRFALASGEAAPWISPIVKAAFIVNSMKAFQGEVKHGGIDCDLQSDVHEIGNPAVYRRERVAPGALAIMPCLAACRWRPGLRPDARSAGHVTGDRGGCRPRRPRRGP